MNLVSSRTVTRREVVADNGVVATKHPLETEAGIAIRHAGGNSIDAAVAVSAVGWVVEPWMTCAGGVGFLLFHDTPARTTHSVEFPPRAPAAAVPDMYRWRAEPPGYGLSAHDVEGEDNSIGHRAVATPGVVAGLLEAHRRWGSLSLAQLLEPAIDVAENGHDADWQLGGVVASRMASLTKFPATAETFLPGGFPAPFLAVNTRVKNRDLAECLKLLARGGSETFYRGEIAHAIDSEMRANEGLLSLADLQAYQPIVGRPLRLRYRGFDVLTPRGPGGHWTELQILQILQQFDMSSLGHNTEQSLHVLIESIRSAFADRHYHLADPEFEPVPLEGLLSPDYGKELAQQIDPGQTGFTTDVSPAIAFEHHALHDPWRHDPHGKAPKIFELSTAPPDEGHTTNFSIIDRDRRVVVCTQTAGNLFGSMVTVPGTGVLLNDGMVWFNPKPGTANSVAGGKRSLVNMGPMIVLKCGKPFLGIGAPGGQRIISCLVQVLSNVVDHGMSIQDAISAPRVDASTSTTYFDDRLDHQVEAVLGRKGHHMVGVREELNPLGWDFAHPTCVMVDGAGRLRAGVDPFRVAEARGL